MTFFEAKNVKVRYGGLPALDDVTLELREGQLVGLIGPNGAGKTTFIDAVAGFTRASGGDVVLAGRTLIGMAAHKRHRLGLARTFQSLELFEDLTVRENLLLAAEPDQWWNIAIDMLISRRARPGVAARADEILELLEIDKYAATLPNELSLGNRKLVTVGRGLVSQPKLLLLDEPAAGLTAHESLAFGQKLRRIARSGTTMLLVDHDMGLVLNVCDFVYVLDFGKLIASGKPAAIRANARVIDAYLGAG